MWKNQAINLLNSRIKTIHSTMPRAKEIAEKLDELLPYLRAYETPVSYRDARSKAGDYENVSELHSRTDAFLVELKRDVEKEIRFLGANEASELISVAQSLTRVLSGVVSDTANYLKKTSSGRLESLESIITMVSIVKHSLA